MIAQFKMFGSWWYCHANPLRVSLSIYHKAGVPFRVWDDRRLCFELFGQNEVSS